MPLKWGPEGVRIVNKRGRILGSGEQGAAVKALRGGQVESPKPPKIITDENASVQQLQADELQNYLNGYGMTAIVKALLVANYEVGKIKPENEPVYVRSILTGLIQADADHFLKITATYFTEHTTASEGTLKLARGERLSDGSTRG